MRRKFTVYGLRFSKTSFWNRMNTGFLDPAVATVPTACGIETTIYVRINSCKVFVATVPTACGIETVAFSFLLVATSRVATVPTACGIETCMQRRNKFMVDNAVATVPTACGIETRKRLF